jgi:hypothetical protein
MTMRAIRMTCATALLTATTAIMIQPAAATPCADLFPFICLFGPEAQAMEPAPPVTVAPAPAPAPKPPRRRIARKIVPMHASELAQEVEMLVEAKVEPPAEPKVEAKIEAPTVSVPVLSYGPGPAFAMSVRLGPSMLEQISPRNSACMVEQTFNDLFKITPHGPDSKLAAAEPEPPRPMMLVAIKTGSTGLLEGEDASDFAPQPETK